MVPTGSFHVACSSATGSPIRAELPLIRLSDYPGPLLDSCILWVRDNGVGFDMKYHDRIFTIFQRLHRAGDYAGTGVGLAIVRKAMERTRSRAWAESEPGKGATFHLEVPE